MPRKKTEVTETAPALEPMLSEIPAVADTLPTGDNATDVSETAAEPLTAPAVMDESPVPPEENPYPTEPPGESISELASVELSPGPETETRSLTAPAAAEAEAHPAPAADDSKDVEAEETPAEDPAELDPPKGQTIRRVKRAMAANDDAGRTEGINLEEKQPPQNAAAGTQDFYHLDFHALDRDLSPEQRQEWNSIYASYRGRSVMTGTIVGIDPFVLVTRDRKTGERIRHEMLCAVVIPFRVRILIPATEMWAKGKERPDYVLRNMYGASIDFVITMVNREDGYAIASRQLAARTRRYYFSTASSLRRPGSRIKCRVLAVGNRRCLVECYGHDVNLTQRELRYSAIPDLKAEYHNGDELDCLVKEYDAQTGELTISVKEINPNPFDEAPMRHPAGCTRQAVIAGKYAGGVFCNLPDGAVCMCSYAFHYDDASFEVGDAVMVLIQRYEMEKKQIYGKIVAKW